MKRPIKRREISMPELEEILERAKTSPLTANRSHGQARREGFQSLFRRHLK